MIKSSLSRDEEIDRLHHKSIWFMMVIGIFLSIIFIRLFYLQVYEGEKYSLLANHISLRKVEEKAIRGSIFDRNGKLVAGSRNYLELSIVPQFTSKSREQIFESIHVLTGVDVAQIKEQYNRYSYLPAFQPRPIIDDLSFNISSNIEEYLKPIYDEEEKFNFQGVEVVRFQVRDYLYPEVFSHALGYLQEIDKKSLSHLEKKFPNTYAPRDLVGASGLEKKYDLILKGKNGLNAHVVDALGREVHGNEDLELLRRKTDIKAIAGLDLITTLDFDTQLKAYHLLKGKRGAVVALDPNSGEVLTFISSPAYNANRILINPEKEYWQKINLDEDRYLYNRAHQAAFPPGSIYKIISAYAGLENNLIDKEKTFYCPGYLKSGNRKFKCWKHSGHGKVNLIDALAKSCDVYFYKLALELDVDDLYSVANLFGLNQKTGIDIPYENSGHIPTKKWKQKRFGQAWIDSETLSLIIGQSYNLMTPLQAAKMISMIANRGHFVYPHLFKSTMNSQGKIHSEWPEMTKMQILDKEKVEMIEEGLKAVIETGGTASRLRHSQFKMAGKTGTAQVIGHDSGGEKGKFTEDHAWFVGYAPIDDPKIAVAVFVENGGSGSKAAAPIAKEVMETYLAED